MIARRSDKKWKSSNESGKKSTRQACLNLHAMYIFLVLSFSGFVYDAIVRWSNCWLSNSDVGIVHVQFCICLSCFWYVWTAEPNWFQKRDTSKAASIKFIYLCNSYTYYIYIYIYIYIHTYIYIYLSLYMYYIVIICTCMFTENWWELRLDSHSIFGSSPSKLQTLTGAAIDLDATNQSDRRELTHEIFRRISPWKIGWRGDFTTKHRHL